MPTVNFSICQNFKISNLIFKCSKEEERSLEFVLVDQQDKHYTFPNLIPESNNYLFLKIDRFEKIISVEGEYIKLFKMKKKDLLNKNLYDIRNGEAYQFSFKINKDDSDLVCSIYPCYIPGKTSSVDIVIRKPQITMTKESVDSYVLECSNVQKVNSN